ncbi:ATP-NAD kinase [Sporomusa ovata DSM 2662]|uniref:Acetoin catabolism protein X n=1 Tax=Sporomusa ovata TaxID=2378 RepID=A0A0U1L1D7_9FIRM|nr:NAD(+)/NADH kinase [Sporomusa ovata]EQB24556.1 acetoin catabolism protein X [Sporomusa ovata DSM 2662]CQR73498.1 Acetoin catabolism protein X [Sporomusa ovata]
MGQVGIIANPASGKDIRRLVAYGTIFDNQEKVNIVRRLILSLAASGIKKIVYMPEYYGIVPGAAERICSRHRPDIEIVQADICMSGTQIDSFYAAEVMARSGVACIVTLGGDGTNRMVAKGCRDVPLLPISTGTNNVFPTMIESTIAGLAAGVVAQGFVTGAPAINPSKKLIIYKNGEPVDIALVDAVVLNDSFIGSRAVWNAERIIKIVVTRGEPHNIGIASIAGNLAPVTPYDDLGLVIEIGPGNIEVRAPIAPGLNEKVPVRNYHYINVDEVIEVTAPCVIALDGEREVEVRPGDDAQIKLTFDGPKVIKAEEVLRAAVAKGYSYRNM